jgi:hypothetical protein
MFTTALIAYFASRTPTDQEGGPLHFGNSFLSGLFGTIVGLVGTYFGIKSSGDASQKAQELARAMAGAIPDTTPDGTTTVDKESLAKAAPQGKTKNGKP